MLQALPSSANVLLGRYESDWKQVLHEHFPEPVDTEVIRPAQDCALAENFSRAIDLLLTRTLNEKKSRGSQYIYLAPGGDHGIHKELLTSPLDHLHCFEEMLCITKFLPKGDISEPNATLQRSGSTCPFIAPTARSTSAAGVILALRQYKLSPSTSRVFFSLDSTMARSRENMMSSFAPPPSASFVTN